MQVHDKVGVRLRVRVRLSLQEINVSLSYDGNTTVSECGRTAASPSLFCLTYRCAVPHAHSFSALLRFLTLLISVSVRVRSVEHTVTQESLDWFFFP